MRFVNRVTEDGEVAHFAERAGFAFAVEVEFGLGMINKEETLKCVYMRV
jgi:hypothetical protein